MSTNGNYDVVIIGGGLAGLSLARHILMETDKRVLLLEQREQIPPSKQKYGESSVQVAGYYYAKILQLEEYLFLNHFMKYNLRFFWKTTGLENCRFEDFSQAFIRTFSNIPCYQLDRNTFEGELLRRNLTDERFTLSTGIRDLDVRLYDEGSLHQISFSIGNEKRLVQANWVVDTSGRGRHLAREMQLEEETPIQHGSAFMWVDGLVDIEKLTDLSAREVRLNKVRQKTGHSPQWLATNHFMGEGFWFWVIPLQGKTSLGVVFDSALLSRDRVNSPEKLLKWICDEFPLFEPDLKQRKILDFSVLRQYAHGCKATINPAGWAMSGEAGRFTDPLYSPGSDFIAVHNSLIVDAIKTDDRQLLQKKCLLFETLMQSLYRSLLPTYAASYDVLGDPEVFALKYTWELSVYFAFFVFPFINDLTTNVDFVPTYLFRFARLGELNSKLQSFLSGFYQWKKSNRQPLSQPVFHDFTSLETLKLAEKTFYRVGVDVDEAREVLDDQLVNLKELSRFIVAHVYSVVLADETVVNNKSFVDSIAFKDLRFDPEAMATHYAFHAASCERAEWSLDTSALREFATTPSRSDGISVSHAAFQADGDASQLALLSQLESSNG